MMQTVTTIQGERVLLRPSKEGDIEESVRVWTPELTHMYGGSRRNAGPPTVEGRRREAAEAKADPNDHRFCIEVDGQYIGHVALRTNDAQGNGGYRIGIVNPEYWGRGYGREVTCLMLRYAFGTLDLHRVALWVAAYNLRARRCYEKCGFRAEGIARENFQADGEWQDDVLMGILQHEWEAQS